MSRVLGSAGVNASSEAVIISGRGLTKEAALAFAMLEKLGQEKVSVFIQSADKWAGFGLELVTGIEVKTVSQKAGIPKADYIVNLQENIIINAPQKTHGVFPKVFIASGEKVSPKKVDGKVIHVPYTSLLNADGTPKSAKEIWNIITNAGISRYAELVCCSDEPGEAAINYFILKLMGFPDVKMLVS